VKTRSLESWRNLLVIKPTSIGDVVQSLTAVCALKDTFPDRRVSFLVADSILPLLVGHKSIDELIVFPRTEMKKGPLSFLRAMKRLGGELKARHYDVTLDLQGLARSAIAARLSGAPIRVGFTYAREGATLLYTHKVKADRKDDYAVVRYLKGAAFLGAAIPAGKVRFGLMPSPEAVASLRQILPPGPYAAVVPGGRWEIRRWPAAHFVETCRNIMRDTDLHMLILGSRDEMELCSGIASTLPGSRATSLAGNTDLPGLAAALSLCEITLTNDTGPMHISAALGIPTVSIWGSTEPRRTGPYGQERWIIQTDMPCRACYKKKCATMPSACMADIQPSRVLGIFMAALNERRVIR